MINYGKQLINDDDIKAVVKTLKSDFLTQGNKIEEFEKKTISEIFKKNGEKYFRNIEEVVSLKFLKFP